MVTKADKAVHALMPEPIEWAPRERISDDILTRPDRDAIIETMSPEMREFIRDCYKAFGKPASVEYTQTGEKT